MSVSMSDTQFVVLTAVETDASGDEVTPQDQLTWSADDNGAVVTLTVSDDTFSATATAVALGTANVTVTDSGANLVSEPFAVDVTAGPATSIVIEAGSPQDQAPSA